MTPGEYRRILVPLALDAGEAKVLAHATNLASRADGRIFLLHVLPESDSDASARALAQSALDEIARASIAAEVPREILVGTGDPATVILDFERVIPADLVLMRTHGRVTALRKALGTVTERVVRESVCPVLAVPEAA